MIGADLISSNLSGADLTESALNNADLSGSNLERANLRRAQLSGVDLTAANLERANLSWANLAGADLTLANTIDVNLENANLTSTKIDKSFKLAQAESETENRKVENLIEKLNQELAREKKSNEEKFEALKIEQDKNIEKAISNKIKELDEKQKEQQEQIKEAKETELDPIIRRLDSKEKNMRLVGRAYFGLGALMIVFAIFAICIDLFLKVSQNQGIVDVILNLARILPKENLQHQGIVDVILNSAKENLQNQSISQMIINSAHLLAIVLLFVTLAKYFYGLGKSYMHESIVCSERRHALDFSFFFLKTFPAPDNYKDRKDLFSAWNKERSSGFHNLKSEDIDPKIVEMVASIMSAVKNQSEKSEDSKKS